MLIDELTTTGLFWLIVKANIASAVLITIMGLIASGLFSAIAWVIVR